jgi:uncharacterized protein (UPF0335 family)
MADHETMTNAEIHAVTADELRSFLERFEQLESEKKDISEQQRELLAELVGRGYDKARFKDVVKIRAMDPEKRAEAEAVLELYKTALGMQ